MIKQNVLLLGSGGREHVFAWKIEQSKCIDHLWIAPGNAGTAQHGTNININVMEFDQIKQFVIEHDVNLIIVGPEDPLVNGIVDYFENDAQVNNVNIIGPNKIGAQLEGSKDFAKQFMKKYNIPTAAHMTFTDQQVDIAMNYIDSIDGPYVIKADGLAAGKGVFICKGKQEAKTAINEALVKKKFGTAGSKVLIEQFLEGVELSVFVVTDGKNYLLLPEAKDYKRIGEGDTGLNTGGMGAISPVPFADQTFMQKVISTIIEPTIKGIQNEHIKYKGFIFFGLINVNNTPYVIEYNVRMGDPETQVVIPRINNDFLELFNAVTNSSLDEIKIEVTPMHASTVIVASHGYPENYEIGKSITIPENITLSHIFHSGTKYDSTKKQFLTNGGRVLAVTSLENSLVKAIESSYQTIHAVHFENMYFRKDIGYEFI